MVLLPVSQTPANLAPRVSLSRPAEDALFRAAVFWSMARVFRLCGMDGQGALVKRLEANSQAAGRRRRFG